MIISLSNFDINTVIVTKNRQFLSWMRCMFRLKMVTICKRNKKSKIVYNLPSLSYLQGHLYYYFFIYTCISVPTIALLIHF